MIDSDRLRHRERVCPDMWYREQKRMKNITYNPVLIYFLNWIITIQGHRRAGSISQHALSERQGNIPATLPVYHGANKETHKQCHTYGNLEPWKSTYSCRCLDCGRQPDAQGKNMQQRPHRAETPSNFLLQGNITQPLKHHGTHITQQPYQNTSVSICIIKWLVNTTALLLT